MFNFDLKKTGIWQAVRWEKFPVFRYARKAKKISLVLFIISFLLFLYGFLPENFSEEACKTLLGLSTTSLVLTVFFWSTEKFFNTKLKKPKLKTTLSEVISNPEKFNLAEFLSFEVARAVNKSFKFVHRPFKKKEGITSTHLFYFLLKDNPKLKFIFFRALLNLKEIKKTAGSLLRELSLPIDTKNLNEQAYFDDFQKTILESLKIAQKKNHSRIEIGDVISALAKHDLFFEKILVGAKLKVEDIENLTWWLEDIEEEIEKRKKFWEYENLAKRGTLAKQWTAGYTITLDKYSADITERIRKYPRETVGHKEEIKMMETILSRREINNALIIGEPGTGRRDMIYALSRKSLLGQSLEEVNYKRVVELDMPALLAQTESIDEAEVVLDKVFQEAVLAGNIILVIDEFHNYVGQVTKPGIIDISGVITPYLRLPLFQIVAITTYEGLHRYIEKNPSLLSLFEKVEVSGTPPRETLILLERLTAAIERENKIFVSYPALSQIISLTERYFSSLPFPEKATDILDEVAVYVESIGEKVVLPKHVAHIITKKTEIPVGEIEVKEKEVLLDLENLIHQRIINQDEAVKEVSTAMRRARADFTIRKGPIGTFLFLGPTGVGKTETSKALAEVYFGSEKRMIRLDMSEFQAIKDIPRLIGSPTEIGLLTTPVRENPFSLVLLDEIEKSHSNILNLFLQVLDEGHLTDGLGRKVDFKNTIIIATSNAGYEVILKALKERAEWSGVKQELLDYLFDKGLFRPEFINRFDAVVVFRPLTKENLLDISELMLQGLKKNLKEKGVEFIITKPLKEKIVELGYSPVFGAREMRRVIQDKVENVLASALLSGELKRGNRVEINPEGFKLVINPG